MACISDEWSYCEGCQHNKRDCRCSVRRANVHWLEQQLLELLHRTDVRLLHDKDGWYTIQLKPKDY